MPFTPDADQLALIHQVEFRADQLTAGGQQIGANYERIYEELKKSANKIIRKTREEILYEIVQEGQVAANAALTASATKLIIPLPDGFLRFVRLECAHLTIPITDLMQVTHQRYRMESNPNSSADIYRPLAFLIPKPGGGGYAIELRPGTATEDPITTLLYCGETLPEDMPESLLDGLVYAAAAAVLMNDRAYAAARAALALANDALEGLLIGTYDEQVQGTRRQGRLSAGDDVLPQEPAAT